MKQTWLLGLSTIVAACTTSAEPPASATDLQMNDLSVLLPLPRNQAELDVALVPGEPAVGGALLPESVYDGAGTIGGYDSLRVVAFRLDPCFAQLGTITDATACQPQLRIIYQPLVVADDGSVFAEDAAVHAFYSLTTDQLVSAVTDVVDARRADHGDDDLGPLAPHPVVVAEGLDGALAHRFDSILVKYAGAANLMRVTTLQIELLFDGTAGDVIEPSGSVWSLDAFDVADGSAAPRVIPTLPDAPTNMSFQAGANPLTATFSPMTTSTDNLVLLANFAQASDATAPARQAAFDAALRIENPRDNSPNTIDCASCHMAQPARTLVAEPLGMSAAGDANAFVPDALIPAADLVPTTQLLDGDGVLNIHAFSYRTTSPMINQRVINETAANLAYIATLLP